MRILLVQYDIHTAFMRAPFCAEPFTTATAELPFRFASDFARLTSCVEPNESAAGRFSPDMVLWNSSVRDTDIRLLYWRELVV